MLKHIAFCASMILVTADFGFAQTNVSLGGITVDQTAAIEVTADSLSVNQENGQAIFDGNVLIIQGDLRLSAQRVEVIYGNATSEIAQLNASGGVTFVTAEEAAEAAQAQYDVTSGQLILTGEVLLTQGASAISAEQMTINVADGSASMEGRVRTVLQQGNN